MLADSDRLKNAEKLLEETISKLKTFGAQHLRDRIIEFLSRGKATPGDSDFPSSDTPTSN